tara:strand:+ start:4103 stop:4822 length:720 start_codon:yes stop_codon:yes gene_type:complete
MSQTKEYNISGMTCSECVVLIKDKLQIIKQVENAEVSLESNSVYLTTSAPVSINILQTALPEKYTLNELETSPNKKPIIENKSDLRQLYPLFLIFFYITASTLIINRADLNVRNFMYDFMGIFYIVFSFFKFLDYKNFPDSFAKYDPLAKIMPFYGWSYPFIETILGILFLFRLKLQFALITTLVILGLTTVGVTKVLLNKNSIQCACLGTSLKLPMTKATIIENSVMLMMTIWMLQYN